MVSSVGAVDELDDWADLPTDPKTGRVPRSWMLTAVADAITSTYPGSPVGEQMQYVARLAVHHADERVLERIAREQTFCMTFLALLKGWPLADAESLLTTVATVLE